MTRRALVTGGTGFLGRHVVARLEAAGWTTHLLRRPVTAHAIAAAFDAATPDVVVSLAVHRPATDDPAELALAHDVNVELPRALAAHLADRGSGALVLASSYVRAAGATTPLAAHRQELDLVAAELAATGTPVATLVPTSIYGPNDPRPKLLPALLRAAATGAPIALTDPERRLDLVHVHDAARAFVHTAERLAAADPAATGTFGVRTGQSVTLAQLVDLVEHAADRSIAARWGTHPGRAHDHLDPTLGPPPVPGWHPRIPLAEGLAQAIGSP